MHVKHPLYSTDVGMIMRNIASVYYQLGKIREARDAYQVGCLARFYYQVICGKSTPAHIPVFSLVQQCLTRGNTRHDYCRNMVAQLDAQL
jgi:hypothetical protein